MERYRVRLGNGRVIGPLNKEELYSLVVDNKIKSTDECQIYPTGDWRKVADFKIGLNAEEIVDTAGQSFPKEFQFEKEDPFANKDYSATIEKTLTNIKIEKELEKTLVNRNVDLSDIENIDKTTINKSTLKHLNELRAQEEKDNDIKEDPKQSKVVKTKDEAINTSDSTQMIQLEDLKKIKSDINEQEIVSVIDKTPVEMEKKVTLVEEVLEDKKPEAKKKKIIILAVGLLMLVLIFSEEDKVKKDKLKFYYPQISFPTKEEYIDKEKAKEIFVKANNILVNPTYKNKLKVIRLLRKSVEYHFTGNPAMARLIFMYSDVLDESTSRKQSEKNIFKLVEIAKRKRFVDPDYASAVAYFYTKINKPHAAIRVSQEFNRINKEKPTTELYSVFLKAYVMAGDLNQANLLSRSLKKAPNKKLFTLLTLIDYYLFINDYTKALEMVKEAEEGYAESVPLLLRKCDLYLYLENYKGMKNTLLKIRRKNAESSKSYFGKYLEYQGLNSVAEGKFDRAAKLFKKSLEYKESIDLRLRLASISSSTGNDESNPLLLESESIKYIQDSKKYLKDNNFKLALTYALKATKVAPNFIKAQLHVAKVQNKLGMYEQSINTFNRLYEEFPNNSDIYFLLIDAYIDSYKFTKAYKLLRSINSVEMRNNIKYSKLEAKYYVKKGDYVNAVNKLRTAINKDPLDDELIYELVKVLLKHRRYKSSRILLSKAMSLDPVNIDYRVSNSEIINELDGTDAAIGNLYKELVTFPDNPKLLNAIGILYYRSGQHKKYEDVKKRIKSLPSEDGTLYRFLISSARLDEDNAEIIKNSEKLLEIEPGNLKSRIELAELYIDERRFDKAISHLERIKTRLPTYPKLKYNIAKLQMYSGKYGEAILQVKDEVKANPGNIEGYLLLASILLKQKEYLKAEKVLKKAQKINPSNVEMLTGLASISLKKSQYELALDLFSKAAQIDPSRAQTYKELGDAYRTTGQSRLAIESYDMYLKLSPNSRYKAEIKKYIRDMQ